MDFDEQHVNFSLFQYRKQFYFLSRKINLNQNSQGKLNFLKAEVL